MNAPAFSGRRARAARVLAALAVACMSLAGCSNPGATTCDEYAGKTYTERKAIEKALLEAHDLEPNAMGNALGITQAVNSYCGLNGITTQEKAKRNNANPLEKAVDWSAKSW